MNSPVRPRRVLLVLACVLALAAAVGVTWWNHAVRPVESVPTATSRPTMPPLFATDGEALAAVTAAYTSYLLVTDEIGMDGGINSDRIAPYLTNDHLEETLSDFGELSAAGIHSDGSTHFDTMSLQRYSDGGDGSATVTVYVCVDVTSVRLMDSNGTNVTPHGRPNRVPLEVEFVATNAEDRVLISDTKLWPGDDFCNH